MQESLSRFQDILNEALADLYKSDDAGEIKKAEKRILLEIHLFVAQAKQKGLDTEALRDELGQMIEESV